MYVNWCERSVAAGRGPLIAILALAGSVLGPTVETAWSDLTFRRAAESSRWPPGTDTVSIRVERGHVLVPATLRSFSGRSVSGTLVLDTGAPVLAVAVRVWNQLQLDTLVMDGVSFMKRVRRPLAALELGSARIPDLPIGGVFADSLLGPGELGLFAPSLIDDRALVLDYANRLWAMVPPHFAVLTSDAASASGANLGRGARVRRSRAAYAAVLGPAAVAVPFRLYQSRILVEARVSEPDHDWRGLPLTLLVDTGASDCVLFSDVMAERVSRAPAWPRLRDVAVRTMLGTKRMDATVLPLLAIGEGSPPVTMERIEAGITDRGSLPDLEGEGTLPERVHGLLGSTFLQRFRLTIDYRDQVLWLEPASRPLPRLVATQVGLRLERRWGEMRVASLKASSPAARAGVVVGDVVLMIGGRTLDDLSVEAAERLLEGAPASDVDLVVGREGMRRVVRLRRGATR